MDELTNEGDELAEQAQREQQQIAAREIAVTFRHAEWYALDPLQQTIALVALALDDQKTGQDPGDMLRWHLANSQKSGVHLAPRRVWW